MNSAKYPIYTGTELNIKQSLIYNNNVNNEKLFQIYNYQCTLTQCFIDDTSYDSNGQQLINTDPIKEPFLNELTFVTLGSCVNNPEIIFPNKEPIWKETSEPTVYSSKIFFGFFFLLEK